VALQPCRVLDWLRALIPLRPAKRLCRILFQLKSPSYISARLKNLVTSSDAPETQEVRPKHVLFFCTNSTNFSWKDRVILISCISRVKQYHYRPGQLWGFQEVEAPRISRQPAHESDCTHRGHLPPWDIPSTHFCYRLSQPQGHSAAGRIMSMKNSNDTIGNRTRDLPACSAVPQPTALPRAPISCISVDMFHSPLNLPLWNALYDMVVTLHSWLTSPVGQVMGSLH
jgi:hypothetical protein